MTLNGNRHCHTCQHHKPVPDTDNCACNHPWLDSKNTAMAQLMVQKMGECKMVNEGVEFFVKINQQGIDSGAANWPIDFDPVWLEECTGYEAT